MEEDLNENDLEERLYALIHHVDETQGSENVSKDLNKRDAENAPQSTLRRYWRPGGDNNNPYQKINTPKDITPTNKITAPINNTNQTPKSKPKEEKTEAPQPTPTATKPDLSIFLNTDPQNIVKSVEILDIEEPPNVVELESSDEDEVIEVALPPKPTITIESSDEEELVSNKPKSVAPQKANNKCSKENQTPNKNNRDVSASPVPSVVSSVSDEFIRGDCIALNISSAQPDNHSFDFSLHGSDLLGVSTPSKKKKKKKAKDRVTSTPNAVESSTEPVNKQNVDECFATPKSKAKNKKQKAKSYLVSEKSIPNADVYDSDSNQSAIDSGKNHDSYIVTDKSLPSADVYESDSSQAETVQYKGKPVPTKPKVNNTTSKDNEVDSSDSSISMELSTNDEANKKKTVDNTLVVDLTKDYVTLDETGIEENIVIGNVSGFTESEDYGDESLYTNRLVGDFCSTKVPPILNEDLDFDNLKGKDQVCRRRRYSLTTLRAEMEKFYNESWGGENFNHQEIQKNMSRDKSLWMIDPKDRMPTPQKRKLSCNYCNRQGHRDDTCRFKPAVCFMCGHTGHLEPRCPRKICVNCGSPNFVYSTMCRNCSSWGRVSCCECGQPGHPASHCPDIWRRYHNTIDENSPLEENSQSKKQHQLYCSGCARRGHLSHVCRYSVPFTSLPINSPYVRRYCPVFSPRPARHNQRPQDATVTSATTPRMERHKRQSKSPTAHETHVNKKRHMSETNEDQRKTPSKDESKVRTSGVDSGKAPDFIPIVSNNHDKKGQVIQDNEVSDTSEILTTARIYVTDDIIAKLQSGEGQEWLKDAARRHNVDVQHSNFSSFLNIKGTVGDQEVFHSELRDWVRGDKEVDTTNESAERSNQDDEDGTANIPKNKNNVLRILGHAFESLKKNFGDPKTIYKELVYLRNNHETLLKQNVVSPKKLSNNRDHMNEMQKKLNLIFLGQAGLAGGAQHLTKLYALQEKLTNCRTKKISAHMRQEIGHHYGNVFTAAPRDDYADLLKVYSVNKFAKKKKEHSKFSPKIQRNNLKKSPMQQKPQELFFGKDKSTENVVTNIMRKPPVEKTIHQLRFIRGRLMGAYISDANAHLQRRDLAGRLLVHIQNLDKNPNMSKKLFKKLRNDQLCAQRFLSTV